MPAGKADPAGLTGAACCGGAECRFRAAAVTTGCHIATVATAARLGCFFAQLGLYIALLLPALLSMFAYWGWAAQGVIRTSYKKGGGIRHTCDVYLPAASIDAMAQGKKPAPTAPVVVLVAGGAWMIGHKGYVSMLCRALRRAGFLCIAVDYRYWPQVGVDGMVEDSDAAAGWSLENCAQYGGDPKRMIMVGLSSGAHIAALLLARRAASELSSEADKSAGGPVMSWTCADFRGFVGLGGVYHLDNAYMDFLYSKGIFKFLQHWVFGDTEEVRQSRSPAALVRQQQGLAGRMPPMLLVHGTDDKIVPFGQSEMFRSVLLAAGARDARVVLREGEGHNDPVIHSPLMSDNGTVRTIILNLWRWCAEDDATATAAAKAGAGSPTCGEDWEAAAELAWQEKLQALPSWPRCPKKVIVAARCLTPF